MHLGVVYICAQSCLTLSDPMDCNLPGSSVHGILQARILEWATISVSRGSLPARDQTHVSCISCIGRWVLYHRTTQEASRSGKWYKTNQQQVFKLNCLPGTILGTEKMKLLALVSPLKEFHFLWRSHLTSQYLWWYITVLMMMISAMLEAYSVLSSIYQETFPHLVTQGKVFFQREEIIAELWGQKRASKLKTEREVMNGNKHAHLRTWQSATWEQSLCVQRIVQQGPEDCVEHCFSPQRGMELHQQVSK